MRDWLMLTEHGDGGGEGARPMDLDVEVHGLAAHRLQALLRELGPVNLVGQSFAVFKLVLARPSAAKGDLGRAGASGGAPARACPREPLQVDVSLPRVDSKVRPGHRGILARGDPFLGVREAARRRDLTVNAIAYDPLTGDIEDPFGGLEDIRGRVLRAVDEATFREDPLRALRVVQFAARFQYTVDEQLLEICATVPVEELPPERVGAELRKLLLLSERPSWGGEVAVRARLWRRLHPALEDVDWSAVHAAVDRAACIRRARLEGDAPRSEALLLAGFFGHVRRADLDSVLDRFDVFSKAGFPTRRAVLACLATARGLGTEMEDGALRLAARDTRVSGGLRLVLAVAEAVRGDPRFASLAERAEGLGVGLEVAPPLVRGGDLMQRGWEQGAELGRVLGELYRHQLLHDVRDQAQLLALLEERGLGGGVAPDGSGG